jgi:nucleoside-diphosphate-sugar epimerase
MKMLTERKLVVYGEQFWRPYIHVGDAARGVAEVLEAPAERVNRSVFNVGSTEQNYTKKQLVDLILPHAPDTVVEYVHKNEDPRDYRVTFAKIEATLGFRTERTVPAGIQEVAELVRVGLISDFDAPVYRN